MLTKYLQLASNPVFYGQTKHRVLPPFYPWQTGNKSHHTSLHFPNGAFGNWMNSTATWIFKSTSLWISRKQLPPLDLQIHITMDLQETPSSVGSPNPWFLWICGRWRRTLENKTAKWVFICYQTLKFPICVDLEGKICSDMFTKRSSKLRLLISLSLFFWNDNFY